MNFFTKESLINDLKNIRDRGWIKGIRQNNHGGIGNTLEQLLGIVENNLPIANAAEWELKTQRLNTSSLVTLFHLEPSPRVSKFVPQILLPNYGWAHKKAGLSYPDSEMSFRQTISGASSSDRGFRIRIDDSDNKLVVTFDSELVDPRHNDWLEMVNSKVGLEDLTPQPYWGFSDLEHKAGTKLVNCFFVQAEVKKINSEEHYKYTKILMLKKFSITNLLKELSLGNVYVDFDARTGHNHGTKFRVRQSSLPNLYEEMLII